MKVKLTVGFRKDQQYSISAEEAHKAYYLFLHPDERGIFANGLALRGEQIQEIEPDFQGTMGWNPTHVIDSNDWNEIRAKGIDSKLKGFLYAASQIAKFGNRDDLNKSVTRLVSEKYPQLASAYERRGGLKSMKELLPPKHESPPSV